MCTSASGGKGTPSERPEDEILFRHAGQKVNVHDKVLTGVYDALVASDCWVTDRSRQKSAQLLNGLFPQVRDCGSDFFLRAFVRLCEATDAYRSAPSLYRLGDQFQALEGFLLATRADLGNSNPGLDYDNALELFVSDIDGYLAQSGIPDQMLQPGAKCKK